MKIEMENSRFLSLVRINECLHFFNTQDVVIYVQEDSLWIAFVQGNRVRKYERILLHETPEEDVRRRVHSFLGGQRYSRTILILSRTSVLQKQIVLESIPSESLQRVLDEKLEEVLPYPPDEMAYGFLIKGESKGVSGILLAIPEKHVRGMLNFLSRVGLDPDEIVTEDQALFWLSAKCAGTEDVLIIDQIEERFLAVFTRAGEMTLSRIFLKTGLDDGCMGADRLGEISLIFLEAGWKPVKIILTGLWNAEAVSEISRHFRQTVEILEVPGKIRNFPSLMTGASLIDRYPAISLLPMREKLKKRHQNFFDDIGRLVVSVAIFLCVLVLVFSFHLFVQKKALDRLGKERARLCPEAEKFKRIMELLASAETARLSKEKVLVLLKQLNSSIPGVIRFKELAIDGKDFIFQGESPSHSLLVDTVQKLDRMGSIKRGRL
ncbi:MAG: hypothetical protein NC930_01245, partial [Candidatus Omnitrophica bacterium]|nr:hypothetical protein [Candidatus Omnitrophota bacterium]